MCCCVCSNKIQIAYFYNIQATFENATYCLHCFETREKEMTRFITKESNNFWGNHFFGTIFYSVDFYSKLISKKKNQILLNKIFCSKLLSYLWISFFSQTIIQFSNKPWKSYFKLLAYEGPKRSCFFCLSQQSNQRKKLVGENDKELGKKEAIHLFCRKRYIASNKRWRQRFGTKHETTRLVTST